jgi:hypothetical protein
VPIAADRASRPFSSASSWSRAAAVCGGNLSAVTVDRYGHFEPHADCHHIEWLAESIKAARREREDGGPYATTT